MMFLLTLVSMSLQMMLLLTLVLMSLTVGGGQAELAVLGPNHVEVSAGEEATLICQVKHPYKFCTFIHPDGTTLNLDPHVNFEEGRISFSGSEEEETKTSCGVKISSVVDADIGAWRCQVTAVINGHLQVGKSEATITLIPPTLDTTSIDTNVAIGENEGSGGGRLEASPNAGGRLEASPNAGGRLEASPNAGGRLEASPNAGGRLEASPNAGGRLEASLNAGGRLEASPNPTGRLEASPNPTGRLETSPNPTGRLEASLNAGGRLEASPNPTGRLEASPNPTNLNPEDMIGDQMGEILSAKLVENGNKTNGKGLFVHSTEFIHEAEINSEELFSGTTDQKQDSEFNQATSPGPRIVDFIPSKKNPDSEYLKEIISTPVFEEEFKTSKDEQLNDLTDEHVLVVIIITMILTAIFITFIAKIKKVLCFRLTDNKEDVERSTLKMDSNHKNRKLSQKREKRVKITYE